ncbi:hypothetical protein REPUB_Repub07fG0199300 [Reevesia pubescens]
MKPNLSLKMRNENAKEHFSDMTLLRKPEPMSVDDNFGLEKEKLVEDRIGDFTLLRKPEQVSVNAKIGEKLEQFEDLEDEGEGWRQS